jgi:Uncharacterized conserved protein
LRSRRFFVLAASMILALSTAWAGQAYAHPPGDDDGDHEHPPAAPAPDSASPGARHLTNIPRSSAATQSDLAFQGEYAFVGNYNGFRIIDISDPAHPVVVRDVWCPGAQNDISVWGDAIVLSVDSVRANSSCDAGPSTSPSTTGWEGIRVFSLKKVLAATPDGDGFTRLAPESNVYTDCGSHTHTGIPDGNRILVYVSSYPLRGGPSCGPGNAAGKDPLHKIISIVEVPLGNLSGSNLLKTVPIDVPTWDLLASIPGFNPMQGCHDIQAYPKHDLAAAACSSVGQLWDISDPENPKTLDPLWEVDEPEVEFYHSAAFNNKANVVIFGDESIFKNCDDGSGSGQIWFYDRASGARHGSFQIPRDQDGQYCSAHLFYPLSNNGDKLVSAWYNGGVTVVDFSDPSSPREIAFYDPAPKVRGEAGLWAAYPYNGYVYSNGLYRGFDSYFIPQARGDSKHRSRLNPQTQE